MVQVQIFQMAILFHCIESDWIMDCIGLDLNLNLNLNLNLIQLDYLPFQWGQFRLNWIVQSKTVKIKGRIYP